MTEIYAALAAVMEDCKAVAKRDRNEHQRFMFRGIDAVVNAVGPILRKHKVIVVPEVQEVAYDHVRTSTDKPATACRVLVTYTFYAADGSSVATRVAAEAWDHGDKAAPKAMSVAFRTALLQSLALPTDDPDPDSQTYEHAGPTSEQAADPPATRRMSRNGPVTDKQLKMIGALMGEVGIRDREERLAYVTRVIGHPVESSKELSKSEASAVLDALQQQKEATS